MTVNNNPAAAALLLLPLKDKTRFCTGNVTSTLDSVKLQVAELYSKF